MVGTLLTLSNVILYSFLYEPIVYFYLFGIGFITFVSPGLLIWIQQYKYEIRGPWDEAVLRKPQFKHKTL